MAVLFSGYLYTMYKKRGGRGLGLEGGLGGRGAVTNMQVHFCCSLEKVQSCGKYSKELLQTWG
jgi:hypothetical protein